MAEVIVVKGLSAGYGERRVLDGVDLVVREGEVAAVIGPNGSGKTTLLRAVAGIIPYSGSVKIAGVEISSAPPPIRPRLLSYAPATVARADITVGDFLLTSPNPDAGLMEWLIEYFGLTDLISRRLWETSSGELRRVVLARALASKAAAILIDEPVTHLDIRYQLRVMKALRLMSKRGKAVLITLNNLVPSLAHVTTAYGIVSGSLHPLGDDAATLIRRIYGVEVAEVELGGRKYIIPVDEASGGE